MLCYTILFPSLFSIHRFHDHPTLSKENPRTRESGPFYPGGRLLERLHSGPAVNIDCSDPAVPIPMVHLSYEITTLFGRCDDTHPTGFEPGFLVGCDPHGQNVPCLIYNKMESFMKKL